MSKASRKDLPKVLTANHLIEGDVVYMSEEETWVRDLQQAEVFTDEAHAQLRLLEASAQSETVVGVYLADVVQEASGIKPAHFREDFRATGPSNYAHGKQVELA